MKTQYTVTILQSGQQRPYADTIREYLITCMQTDYINKDELKPGMRYGDIEAQIKREEADRAAGRMSGGYKPDDLRKMQRDWAKGIVRALCQNFREKQDDDGKTGMEAHFYPTLKTLTIDAKAGIIRVVIIEPYTD